MEIATEARPPAPTPWGRLVLSAVLLGPVSLLVLLPVGLGLERYVMTGRSMDGSVGRGSVAFERVVPVSDLRVGDVITFPQPESADEDALVTHRIVAVERDGIRTQGDASDAPDPWVLHPDTATMSRVEFAVPWVGWVYLLLFRPLGWLLAAAVSAAVLLLMSGRLRRLRRIAAASPREAVRTEDATPSAADPSRTSGVGPALGTREAKR
jgi:signal peptidase